MVAHGIVAVSHDVSIVDTPPRGVNCRVIHDLGCTSGLRLFGGCRGRALRRIVRMGCCGTLCILDEVECSPARMPAAGR